VHLYLCLTQGALISMSQRHWLKHVMLFWRVRVHDLVVNSFVRLMLVAARRAYAMLRHMLCQSVTDMLSSMAIKVCCLRQHMMPMNKRLERCRKREDAQ